MIKRIKKPKKIRIYREGADSPIQGFTVIAAIALLLWCSFEAKVPFYAFTVIFETICRIVISFFQRPIHYFPPEGIDKIVVASADGKIVVVEEVEEDKYLHEERLVTSVFMSLFSVHASRFPVNGKVKLVHHQNGNYHKAWLPKASEEDEYSDIIITMPDGVDVLCRQIVGAMARHIMICAKEGEDYYIGEYLGFTKSGSRVDVHLPIGTEACVKMGQKTIGDHTVITKLK